MLLCFSLSSNKLQWALFVSLHTEGTWGIVYISVSSEWRCCNNYIHLEMLIFSDFRLCLLGSLHLHSTWNNRYSSFIKYIRRRQSVEESVRKVKQRRKTRNRRREKDERTVCEKLIDITVHLQPTRQNVFTHTCKCIVYYAATRVSTNFLTWIMRTDSTEHPRDLKFTENGCNRNVGL